MQTITLHDTESEEIMGMVTTIHDVDFDKFYDEVKRTWIDFQKTEVCEEGDYSIEDFVEFHNENSKMEIDYVINEFIQL